MASYVQTDGAHVCGVTVLCSGLALTDGTPQAALAEIGGTEGVTEERPTLAAADSNQVFWGIDYGTMPSGFVGVAAGTFVFKVNVTTVDTGALEANEVHLCRVDNVCGNPLSIASSTGLTETLSAGVHTFNVTIASPVSVTGTQRIVALLSGRNPSIMSATFTGITPDQTDTIPLTAAGSGLPNSLLLMGCGD